MSEGGGIQGLIFIPHNAQGREKFHQAEQEHSPY